MTFQIKVNDNTFLKIPNLEDAQAVFDVIDSDREHLRVFLPWVDYATSVENTEENIKERIKDFDEKKAAAFLIQHKGEWVGSVGFIEIDYKNKSGEIGYWLSSKFVGKGMMTDCVRVVVEYGFKEHNLHRISIRCRSDNEKSAGVPKRLNFTFEGTNREDKFVDGKYESSLTYSLLEDEYSNSK